MAKKRYAHVGLGGRSGMYTRALEGDYAESCELVGLCDSNEGRLHNGLKRVQANIPGCPAKAYAAEDFDRMVAETKPDVVIVTTKDSLHHHYICRAMELGCDAVTEKPMTTDAEKCRQIIETQAKTGRKCTVTFNYRYSPPRSQVKDLLMGGVIGNILSVDFHWLLDTRHGADYFRRWHRNKENSGGLMVHKATHHFDLVNWWLSAIPETVFAMGHRRFATPQTADRLGLRNRGERCHGCPETEKCAFELSLAGNEKLKEMYLDCEKHDGYFRDRCVFSDEIDIEDCMTVLVSYDNGVKMSYSLSSFLAWEGYMIAFNGTKGRLEHKCQESVYISGDGSVPGALQKEGTFTKIFPMRAPAYAVDLWKATGGHGGGDSPLVQDVFDPQGGDKLLRAADQRAGAYSILTGVAANESMATGKMIRVSDLVQNIGYPDYPPMPREDEPLPMPAK